MNQYTVSPVRWDTYFQANRVENQKLNQTAAAVVWLSFCFQLDLLENKCPI